jgi:signal transduction histidine kinase
VTCRIEPADAIIDVALMREMVGMLGEAVANARRHGGARSVDIQAIVGQEGTQITITDDGRGFPFHGRFDLAELRDKGQGPRSLCERVAALGGQLSLESTQTGCRIQIRLPRYPDSVDESRPKRPLEEPS